MHRFSVWAPERKSIALKLGNTILPMAGPSELGWWQLDVESAGHGTSYYFRVDDRDYDYPDPRSHWQPEGVHGASRVYDHSLFAWTDADWNPHPFSSAIVYELHVGTFTTEGTLDAAIERVDHLLSLGVTHVELMPVNAFDGKRGWGYDGAAIYAPAEIYGGPDAVKRFVNACHARGLAVLLDVVYNHFGPVGNYSGVFGPYTTDVHHTPWGAAINFENAGSDQVRRFFIDNAFMWLRDYHFDGLRLDAIHAFVDRSAVHFLEQLSAEVETLSATLGRQLSLIAESDLNDPRIVTPREASGYGMDAQWSDDFHHSLFSVLADETGGYYGDFGSVADLAKSLQQVFVYDGRYSRYRRALHGRRVGNLSFHRFLGYIQNHDQIGNRAKGDRLVQAIGYEKARLAAAIVLTAPFVPMLFQGEEWAASTPFNYFVDHQDDALRTAVHDGRQREFAAFGWDPSEIADPNATSTFANSKLRWEELDSKPHREMLAWYRQLIHLRHTTRSLNLGDPGSIQVEFSEADRWLTVQRGEILCLFNLADAPQSLSMARDATRLLATHSDLQVTEGKIELRPFAAVVLQIQADS